MEHYIGIDVSLELSSLCVLDATGKVIREAKVASEPEVLVAFLRGLGVAIARVGLEAGPLSQWLYDGLTKAGFDVVLLETRHVKAALSAMAIKTDRRDARGSRSCYAWAGIGRCTAVDAFAGGAGPAGRAQADADQGHGYRANPSRAAARLWAEGRRREPRQVVGAHSRTAEWTFNARADRRANAGCARDAVVRVRQAPSRGPRDRQGGPGLPPANDGARCRRSGIADLSSWCGRPGTVREVQIGRRLLLRSPRHCRHPQHERPHCRTGEMERCEEACKFLTLACPCGLMRCLIRSPFTLAGACGFARSRHGFR